MPWGIKKPQPHKTAGTLCVKEITTRRR
jgi:hypothetical protein